MKIGRREFLRRLALVGGMTAGPAFFPSAWGQTNYTGKLVVTLQLTGGVDVTSFCDPKTNVAGEPEINHWARTKSIQQTGNLLYAPYARNQAFFEKYRNRIMVINGVDAQTNSHDAGEIVNWSGRIAVGYPSITALMAAIHAPELALSYLNFGGFGNTESLIRSTRINSPAEIRNLSLPNFSAHRPDVNYIPTSDWEMIKAMHAENMTARIQAPNVPAQDRINRQYYLDAFSRADSIKQFGDLIPSEDLLQQEREIANENEDKSRLHQQAQLALLAFKSGLTISADLVETRGYDTHDLHDANHEALLANSLDAIDYFWDYAEELGLADRIVMMIASDFGRTPFYNASEGKDHWPIGSVLFMEKNANWGNRTFGETDEGHNAYKINAATLKRDNNGTIIYPNHVHKALREYLGIGSHPITQRFAFNNVEQMPFFA